MGFPPGFFLHLIVFIDDSFPEVEVASIVVDIYRMATY